jgi:hypothetical protein
MRKHLQRASNNQPAKWLRIRAISRRPGPLALLPVRAAVPRLGGLQRKARRPEAIGRGLAANRAAAAPRRINGRDRFIHRSNPREPDQAGRDKTKGGNVCLIPRLSSVSQPTTS